MILTQEHCQHLVADGSFLVGLRVARRVEKPGDQRLLLVCGCPRHAGAFAGSCAVNTALRTSTWRLWQVLWQWLSHRGSAMEAAEVARGRDLHMGNAAHRVRAPRANRPPAARRRAQTATAKARSALKNRVNVRSCSSNVGLNHGKPERRPAAWVALTVRLSHDQANHSSHAPDPHCGQSRKPCCADPHTRTRTCLSASTLVAFAP